MPTAAGIQGVFARNAARFDPSAGRSEGRGLRNCQLGAYWAVWAHFTASERPALVSLPTGAGKTALMMALAFGLRARRVLVVTPAATLRDQTGDKFADLGDLRKAGVLDGSIGVPQVFKNERQLASARLWRELKAFDVVVATPKTTSPGEEGVSEPPGKLFDLVFIDEAHHAPAPTWRELLRHFESVRCVLLTATPFRRDNRLIHAPLVYHYSIAKALEDGIYRPVRYVPVSEFGNRAKRDQALCTHAKRLLARELRKGNRSKLLIRADRVNWAATLEHLYRKNGLQVETVDYERSKAENEETIRKLRQGELDGIVCVGMVGEGLDVPELKIAVLHAAPRSLPFTLQFVGRVSRRAETQIGEAYLLSVPEEVRGEMRRLHRADANWRLLVPKLAEIAVSEVTEKKLFRFPSEWEDLDLAPDDLRPFFSVRAYEIGANGIDLTKTVVPGEDQPELSIAFQESIGTDLALFITESFEEPAWAAETGLVETRYNLHIFVLQKNRRLLFELSTSDVLAKGIRGTLASDALRPVPAERLMKVMQTEEPCYYMVGLRNALGTGAAHPAYKMLMGREVQAAVRPTDGQVFAPGHALMKLNEEETRGVATGGARIWALRRGDLQELKDWCEELGGQIASRVRTPELPDLGFLACGEKVSIIPTRPLAVLADEQTLRALRRFRLGSATLPESSMIPYFEIIDFRDGEVTAEYHFEPGEPPVRLLHWISGGPQWKVADPTDQRELAILLEFSETEIFEGTLADYLQQYPPRLILPSGGSIRGDEYWQGPRTLIPIPADCWRPLDWRGFDIRNETQFARRGPKSIMQFVQAEVLGSTSRDSIVVWDHGSGEIADFVAVEPDKSLISFYHCKGSGGEEPGARVGDCYKVLGQACRNAHWIRSPQLMNQLYLHTQPNRRSPVIKGSVGSLRQLADEFQSNAWQYHVVVVQPGLDSSQAQASPRVKPLFLSLYQILRDCDAAVSIWCS